MSRDIITPELGESITEATIAEWLKKPGEPVHMDEPIVVLETDKVTVEVPAPVSGVLKEVAVEAGDNVEVGALLGRIEEGEVAPSTPEPSAPAPSVPAPSAPGPASARPTAPPPPPPAQHSTQSETIASPAARKIAAEKNVPLDQISGSGRQGRVMKEDALAASAQQASAPTGAEERVRMSRLRQTIATKLKEAQNSAAMLTTFNEIDMSTAMALRKKYKDQFEKRYGARLGFMSIFAHACIAALRDVPEVNAQIDGNEIIYRDYYNIGIAVSTERGLLVPVLHQAQNMSLADIEKNIAAYAQAARDGSLQLSALQNGTFTISNGGVYGSLLSTPILNAPQSAILGMHKIEKRPVVIDDQIVIRPMMYVALTYDHRLVDGQQAVTFLVRVKETIEYPGRLMLGV